MFKILLAFFFVSFSAFAQEVSVSIRDRVKHENFSFGIGSRALLTFKDKALEKEVIFLGKMVDQEKEAIEFLFLDEKKTRVMMIDPSNLTGFRKSDAQAIVSPIDQIGSTCAGYGMFHYWNQIFVSKYNSTPELPVTMNSDRKRIQFMEELIDIYYIQNKINITSLMKKYGKRFGFKCRNNLFDKTKDAADFLFKAALAGKPILIDFNISSKMVTSTYEVTDYETPVKRDPRLWRPRKVGEINASGHVIVAAAAFVSNGKKKLLVLDSNWTEPRVWDLDRYIAQKAAVKEMGFHTCTSDL